MALVRFHPWREMATLQQQMNRLFDEPLVAATGRSRSFVRVPAAEMEETQEAIHLKLEVPGMQAKDLDLSDTHNAVYISGERKEEDKNEENGVTKSEFHYGKFQRVIPLPAQIQNTQVQAQYKDGILNLTLPKTESEKNKVVKVNLEQAA